GIGFAIPTNLAKPVVTQLASGGHVVRGWLGVAIQPVTPELAKSFGISEASGALVTAVTDDSPAKKAGVQRGDVITRSDGRTVARARDLPRAIARDGEPRTLPVPVARLAEDEVAAPTPASEGTHLGIAARSLTPQLA